MPPNPERQARLAARREEMANDPKLQEAMEAANAAVLGRGAARTIEPPAAAPRPMLPNYYRRGGSVRAPSFAHGGPVGSAKSYSKGK